VFKQLVLESRRSGQGVPAAATVLTATGESSSQAASSQDPSSSNQMQAMQDQLRKLRLQVRSPAQSCVGCSGHAVVALSLS
jgi:hypothetical protein